MRYSNFSSRLQTITIAASGRAEHQALGAMRKLGKNSLNHPVCKKNKIFSDLIILKSENHSKNAGQSACN
ncbi:MAG: hypothetical protein ACPH8C_01215 [Candidatus Puniceispirillaceae bacterium]